MKRLIKKADDAQIKKLIDQCAYMLKSADEAEDYDSDAAGETDNFFIEKVVNLLSPETDVNSVKGKALEYADTQNVDDEDYVKYYEVLLAGIKQALGI